MVLERAVLRGGHVSTLDTLRARAISSQVSPKVVRMEGWAAELVSGRPDASSAAQPSIRTTFGETWLDIARARRVSRVETWPPRKTARSSTMPGGPFRAGAIAVCLLRHARLEFLPARPDHQRPPHRPRGPPGGSATRRATAACRSRRAASGRPWPCSGVGAYRFRSAAGSPAARDRL